MLIRALRLVRPSLWVAHWIKLLLTHKHLLFIKITLIAIFVCIIDYGSDKASKERVDQFLRGPVAEHDLAQPFLLALVQNENAFVHAVQKLDVLLVRELKQPVHVANVQEHHTICGCRDQEHGYAGDTDSNCHDCQVTIVGGEVEDQMEGQGDCQAD